VAGTVLPGGTYEFKFDFHAPPTAGAYKEYFGLVQDGVAWFSDPGQGGPPDDDIEANIQVTAGSTNCTVDPGVPDGGGSTDGGGSKDGGTIGIGAPDGGSVAQGDGGSPVGEEGGGASDAGPPAAAPSAAGHDGGGCGCDTVGASGATGGKAWTLALVLGVLGRRKRR
jgi:MYXO-CTERM domain-containing protein